MGGYYPALAVQPPPDPTAGIERAVTLRNLLQNAPLELQQRQIAVQQQQQALKDQQVTSRALLDWDGKDPQELISNVVKGGGSANAALGLQQHFLTLRDTASQIAQRDSLTGSTNLKTLIDKHDQFLGAINAAEDVPDAQLHDHLAQTINGLIPDNSDPQSMQFKQQATQLLQSGIGAADLRKQLDAQTAMRQGTKAPFEQAQTQAKTSESQATAGAKQAETKFYQQNPNVGAPGVPAETAQMASFLQQNPGATPASYPAAKAAAVSRAEAPVRIATAQAEGQARANIEAAISRGSNAALATVPPHLVAPATAAATKAGDDYASAVQTTSNMRDFINAAKSGNKEAYAVLPEQGTLQVTTAQGVHRINSTEISQYAGAGSLWDNIMGRIGKLKSGASIPPDVLNDIDKLQGMIAQNAKQKYSNTLKTTNQNYGSKFQPVDMENTTGPSGNDPFAAFGGKQR